MSAPNTIALYVNSAQVSAEFYIKFLKCTTVRSSPEFSMLKLESGLVLGLWSKHTVEPAANATGGGVELGFPMPSKEAVDALHCEWRDSGLTILQVPTQMNFGYTFVALDPDQHRLRVFVQNPA